MMIDDIPVTGPFILPKQTLLVETMNPSVAPWEHPRPLALRSFAPGAVLAFGQGQLRVVADPLRSPRYLWKTLTSNICSIQDMVLSWVLCLIEMLG